MAWCVLCSCSITTAQSDWIAVGNGPNSSDARIDSGGTGVLSDDRSEDVRVSWKIRLGQGRHHAARAGLCHLQFNVRPDSQRTSNPLILGEVDVVGFGLQQNVRAKTSGVEVAFRMMLLKPIQCRCCREHD